jgi:exopolysaccharide production protein ExoQ
MKFDRTAQNHLAMLKGVNRPNSGGTTRTGNSTRKLLAFIPFLALGHVLIFTNLLGGSVLDGGPSAAYDPAPNLGNRLFWPGLFVLTLVLAIRHRSQLRWDFFRSPAIAGLIAYLLLAGASVTWAFSPEHTINRYLVQIMLVTAVVLPYAIETPNKDTLKRLFNWYALAIAINAVWLMFEKPMLSEAGTIFGYQGYFTFKGYLGECASLAILSSLYALRSTKWQRVLALFVIPVSILIIFMSNSKASLAFALVSPVLAAAMLLPTARLRLPMNAVLAGWVGCWFLISKYSNDLINKLSYDFYGDGTLTGRTTIWDFIQGEISRNPWFGWGFHSFWLVGPSSPSITEAPYWVKHMTGSHSGYLDVKLDTGFFGYLLLIFFILATIHAIGRVARTDLFRAWILLSLALFIILTNILETVWFNPDPLWMVFLLVAADATYRRGSTAEILSTPKRRRSIAAYKWARNET